MGFRCELVLVSYLKCWLLIVLVFVGVVLNVLVVRLVVSCVWFLVCCLSDLINCVI